MTSSRHPLEIGEEDGGTEARSGPGILWKRGAAVLKEEEVRGKHDEKMPVYRMIMGKSC